MPKIIQQESIVSLNMSSSRFQRERDSSWGVSREARLQLECCSHIELRQKRLPKELIWKRQVTERFNYCKVYFRILAKENFFYGCCLSLGGIFYYRKLGLSFGWGPPLRPEAGSRSTALEQWSSIFFVPQSQINKV